MSDPNHRDTRRHPGFLVCKVKHVWSLWIGKYYLIAVRLAEQTPGTRRLTGGLPTLVPGNPEAGWPQVCRGGARA